MRSSRQITVKSSGQRVPSITVERSGVRQSVAENHQFGAKLPMCDESL
jgi:hypothetical protein